MRVKWNSSPRDCDGHLRDTDVEYDDFTSRALEDLLRRGFVSPVDEEAHALAAKVVEPTPEPDPTPAAQPIATAPIVKDEV